MIKWASDFGAPAAVAAVNIGSRTIMPEYHDFAVYGMTILGYLGGFLNWGGDFVKNIGVSSLPLTADKVYERIKGGTASRTTRTVQYRKAVARYPAPAEVAPFQGVKLT